MSRKRALRPADSRRLKLLLAKFDHAIQQARQDFAELGVSMPETVEEWEALAFAVGLPDERLQSGDFTRADVYHYLLRLWAQHEITRGWDEARSQPAPATLGTREEEVLQVLMKREAFDHESRLTIAQIARKAAGPDANENNYKLPVSKLHKLGLVDTRSHRGGGCWLSPKVLRMIERARSRQKR